MPTKESKRVKVTISIPRSDFEYLEKIILQTDDSVKTVSKYVRRLVHYYVWSIRIEDEIRRSEGYLKKLQADFMGST